MIKSNRQLRRNLSVTQPKLAVHAVAEPFEIDSPAHYSFVEFLVEQARDLTGRKGARTKARLIANTAHHLETQGLYGLTHNQVCEAADINVSTFYQYFGNKTEIVNHVIDLFLAFIPEVRDPDWLEPQKEMRAATDPYGAFYSATLHILRLAAANPGMYRCVLQIGAERGDIAKRWQEFSATYYERSARRVLRAIPEFSFEELRLKATLLGGMVDDFCRGFFVFADDDYKEPWTERFSSDSEMAIFLTDIWYKTMVGDEPPANKERWVSLFK